MSIESRSEFFRQVVSLMHQFWLVRLEFMDFVLDLPQVSSGEGFQLTFDHMLGASK